MEESGFVRRTLLFSGRVQGVGFRATTVSLARELLLSGYAMNLPDGRVEVMAEGTPADLNALRERIVRRFAGDLREVTSSESAATGEFAGFRIRY
ncbi:MAG: acylphosphatase [Phycisphaerales bacterium]|nr:acylphosphatase [Phycisphaerales bacterium]